MSAPTTGQMPAGWYEDPTTPGQIRWWNGSDWTSDAQTAPQRPVAPPAAGWLAAPSPALTAAPPAHQDHPSAPTTPATRWGQTDAYRIGHEGADLAAGKNTLATVGLVFGIISLVGTPVMAVVGFICSIRGLGRAKRYALAGRGPIGRTKSIGGIVLSSIGCVIWATIWLSAAGSSGSSGTGTDSTVTDKAVVDTSGTYLGTALAADVTRVLLADGTAATDVTCADTAAVNVGVITDCKATIDGTPTGIRVTWDDTAGHFTLTEQAL